MRIPLPSDPRQAETGAPFAGTAVTGSTEAASGAGIGGGLGFNFVKNPPFFGDAASTPQPVTRLEATGAANAIPGPQIGGALGFNFVKNPPFLEGSASTPQPVTHLAAAGLTIPATACLEFGLALERMLDNPAA